MTKAQNIGVDEKLCLFLVCRIPRTLNRVFALSSTSHKSTKSVTSHKRSVTPAEIALSLDGGGVVTAHGAESRPDVGGAAFEGPPIIRSGHLVFYASSSLSARQFVSLALLRGDGVKGCPLLLHVLASAVRTGGLALLILRKGQDFRELLLAGSTEKIVLRHGSLPI